MPVVANKIRLCSNILREPQIFDKFGEFGAGVARDLIIYGVWNDQDETVLHLPDFCRVMGYNRQLLMKPLTEEQKKWILEDSDLDEKIRLKAVEHFRVAIAFVLLQMGSRVLTFNKERERKEEDKRKPARKTMRFDFKKLISRVDIDILSTGSLLYYTIDSDILAHGRGKYYQTMSLPDYLSLKTPAGRADHQARKMYMRLVWKRRYWDKSTKKEGYFPSQDSYDDLKAVAGLAFTEEKQNASRLRKLLKRVGALNSVKMIPTIKLNQVNNEYLVTWKRQPLPNASIAD